MRLLLLLAVVATPAAIAQTSGALQLAQLSAEAYRWDAGSGFRTSGTRGAGDARADDQSANGSRMDARLSPKSNASLGLVPRTSILELQADYRFAENWGVAGRYQGGRALLAAPVEGQPRIGNGRGDGFALGLTKAETWIRGDRLSLTVSQPLRFGGGPLGASNYADAPDYGGLGLRSGAREVMTELNYFTPISKSMGLGLSLINRVRPNSDAQAPDERIMMMRFSTSF